MEIQHSNITIDHIKKIVCDYFNMPVDSLQSKTRKREVVQARQIAMFFSKTLTKSSLALIGSQIGHKNHATCLHSIKTVNNLMDTDKNYKADIKEIEKRLKTVVNNTGLFSVKLKCKKDIHVNQIISVNVNTSEIFATNLINKDTSLEAIERLRNIARLKGYKLTFNYTRIYKQLTEDNFKLSLSQLCDLLSEFAAPGLSSNAISSSYSNFIEKINNEYGFNIKNK